VSANQLNLAAHDLSNVSGNLTQTGSGDSAILLAGNLDNTSGRIASNGNNLTLGAQTLTNSNGTIEHVGTGTLAITATTLNGTHGNIGSNGLLNLTAQTATLDSGSTVAQQLQVNTATLSNRGGSLIQSGTGATQITATTALDNVGGTLASNGATTLTVGTLTNQGGTIQSTGTADLTVHATGNIDNSAQGKVSAGGNGVITAASLNNTHGQLTASNGLQVTTTNAIDNSSGTLAANQAVTLNAGDLTNTSGDVHGHGVTATLTGQLSNTQGQINSSGDLTVNTATGISNSGTLYAHGNANLGTQGNVDNSGVIAAAGNTTLNATGATSQITSHSGAILGAGVQTDGSLGSTGNLTVSATKTVTAQGQNLAGGDLSLQGSSLDLSSSQTGAHNVTLTATSGDVDANHAAVSASQTLTATAAQTLRTDSAHVSANQLNLTAHDVSNAGGSLIQTGSGATTITPVGNLDNHGGVIATAGALTLAGTTIDNSSQGQIQAARVQLSGTDLNNASGAIVQTGTQSSSFALTGQLNNTGGRIGSNGQDLTLTAAQILNNQGTIAHSGTGTLTLGDANSPAAIDNTQGQIGSNGNIRLNASTLGNAGGQVVASNGNLDIHATQNISNVGGTLAAGHALSLVGSGALNNQDGDIEGSSLTLDAASLSNAGAGRVLALNGDAQLTVHGTLANAGTIGGKGVVNVQAVELDNSGALSSTHELTVGAGRIVNSGTLVSDTTLTLNAQNDITNDHGKAQGAQVVLAANSLSNAGGQIVQTGSADDAWTFSGGVNNQSGVISSNAHNLTLSAAQVQNNAGHIDHVGTGTLNITAGAIDNTGGAIGGNGDVTLATNTLTNTAGQVTAQNNLNAAVASTLTNTGGSLSAVHGAINITGNSAVDNTGGTIEAATTLALNARTLTNATSNGNGGRIDALAGNATVSTTDRIDNSGLIGSNADVTLTTTHLSNSGTLSAAHSLALTAQDVTNSGQVLGNDINAQLTASLNNAGGTFSAGNSLTVNAASITNTGGTLSNSGTGLTQVTTSGTLDNTQGLIGGNGNVQVSAAQLTNAQGKLIAGGTLAATSSGLLDNSAGTINATGDITLTANQFTNTNGHLDTRGNVTLAISQLGNSSGNITANGDVAFNATSSSLSNLLGDLGAVAAGNNLTLNLQGDVQFGASNWTANHGLTVKTNGAFSNYGKLGAVGVFELDSTSFYNASNAQLSGNQGLVLNTTGGITNDGVLFGDTVQINAASLTNNNAIYGGDVSATANTLVNQNGAVIAAGRSLQLYGSNISNTGGSTMYSVGNLTLAGLSGANAATVLNQSSTIQGDGNVSIYADHLDNKRTVLNVVTTTLPTQTTTTNLGTTVVSINSGLGERDTTTTQITTTDITQTALVGQDSPAAQILAGGNLLLTGSVNNDASLISAGGQFLFNANIVTNTSYNLGQVQTDTVVQHQVITVHACGANNGGCGSTTSTTDSAPVTTTTTTSTGGYSAILSAGQSINGNATSINNVTVGLAPNATNGTTVSVGGKVTYTSTTVGTPADLAAATSSLPLVGTGTGTVGQTAANAHAPTLVSANTTAAATTTSIAAAAAQPQANIGPELGPSPTSNVASASTINSVMAAPSARPTDLAAVVGPTLPSATTSATVTTAVSHDAAVGPTDIAAAQGTAVSNTMSSASPIKAVRANALLAADDLPQTPELALPTRTSVTTPTVSRIGPTVSRSLASLSFAVGPAGLHFQLPTSALFHINTGPNQRYLVETDPRFTQYSNFISSDYMLQLMKLDPATAQKRLGDAFYENQLITDQIGQLTGKRFLDGYASQEAEYRALMNAGAAYGQQFNLRPGVSLTAAQMASLTTDMVWLESRNIDGQDVLVPVVYLANVTQAAMQTGLAQINAKSIDLTVQNGLTNSGLITTQAGTKITAGQISNLGGSITSQGDLKLAASAGDLLNQAGTLSGKNVTLSATGNLLDLSQAVTANANQSADPNAIRLASIKADGNLIMQAGQDLTVTAGQISATGDASLHAARNLTLDTLATSSTTTQLGTNLNNGWFAHDGTVSTASQTTQHVTGLNIGGNTVLTAGQDATLTGAQVQSAQKITLAAGGNVTVQAALEKTSSDVQNGDRYHAAQSDDHLLGSTLHAGTDLIVAAGQNGDATKPGNLTITSSNVTSDKGPVQLVATGNVVLGTQTETHTTFLETRKDIGGILSSGESHDRNTSTTTLAIGSTVSGDSVVVTAGKDLTVTGSGIAASKDLALTAGNQLTIQAATNTETTSHLHEEHQSGLTGMSLTQISIGTRSEKDTADTAGTTQSQSRSTVGSVGGNVTLVAGKDVNVLGSDLIVGQAKNDLTGATGNLLLQGQNVHIDSGADSQQSKNTYESRQVGITATLGGVAGQFVQAAEQATKAQEQGDDRLTALYATKAGLTAYNAVTGPATAGGVPSSMFKVSVSVGASSSSSDSTSQTLVHQGSTLTAGNDVHLIATGSGSKDAQGNATDGDLIARGVQISGKNVSVSAARDIDLLSATDTAKTDSHNDSSSASIGVGFSMGGQQNGFTLELAAAKANGFSNGNGTTNQNSQITATDTLTLQSGRDANLIGAQARGNKVETDIGRDLNVISLQDTDTYRAKQDSSGFNASVCVPPFCYGTTVSASVSVGKGKTNSDYQSVGQQTGLYAGSDGYDIKVKNNTNLTGAVIASAADASKNSLSTGTLTTGNLQNHAEYDSSNTNISLSANIGTSAVNAVAPSLTSNLTDNLTANLANLSKPKLSGDADGTTKSAISAGTVTITDDAKQKELTGKNATDTVASLNRDTASANGNIGKIFDLKTIQREQEVQTALASVAQEVQVTMNNLASKADAKNQLAKDKETQALDPSLTADQRTQLINDAAQLKQDAAAWAPGGTNRQIVTAVLAAATSDPMGSAGQLVRDAAVSYLQQQTVAQVKTIADAYLDAQGHPTATSEAMRTALQTIVGCAGAAASSQHNCGDGATGAAASVVINNLLDKVSDTDAEHMTAAEKEQRIQLVQALAGGIAVAAKSKNIATVVNSAQMETENNALAMKAADLMKSARSCSGSTGAAQSSCFNGAIDQAKKDSKVTNARLAAACTGPEADLTSCKAQLTQIETGNLYLTESLIYAKTPEQEAALIQLAKAQVTDVANLRSQINTLENNADAWDHAFAGATQQMLDVTNSLLISHGLKTIEPPTVTPTRKTTLNDNLKPDQPELTASFSTGQLDKKFKHADDFGVITTKKNPDTLAQYQAALEKHLNDPTTQPKGTYGFVPDSVVYFNPNTNNVVVLKSTGEFVTGWKLDPQSAQYQNFIKNGVLR
uniref:hemagglutinin repeat-containing protein n=1 Tax=Andreprevotia chitinilytica TaxID=396808 RepID=UPI00055019AA